MHYKKRLKKVIRKSVVSSILATLGITPVMNATAKQNVYTFPQSAVPTLSVNNPRVKSSRYKHQYQLLYHSLRHVQLPDTADKAALYQGFNEWAKSENGKRIIAGMPLNVKFSPHVDTRNKTCLAYYNPKFQTITLGNLFEICKKMSSHNKQANYAEAISHECIHAYQYQQGILRPIGLSPAQFVTQEKLAEAEAYLWGKTEALIQAAQIRSKSENIHTFCHMNIKGSGPATKIALTFQKYLKAGIPLESAAKNTVSDELKNFMGFNMLQYLQKWHTDYDRQSIAGLLNEARLNHISKSGNMKTYTNILNYYKQHYKIQHTHIDHSGKITPSYQKQYHAAINYLSKKGLLVDSIRPTQNNLPKQKAPKPSQNQFMILYDNKTLCAQQSTSSPHTFFNNQIKNKKIVLSGVHPKTAHPRSKSPKKRV